MITKIISGGQTGADRAALDAAIKLRIPYGGWVPKGRITENGILPQKYNLMETPTAVYAERTEKNILDSDGTLILSHGLLTGGSEYTRVMALKLNKPYLHVDLNAADPFNAAANICIWLSDHEIKVLNVAGPRSSKDPDIYAAVFDTIESVYYLGLIESDMEASLKADGLWKNTAHPSDLPKTVDEAVEDIIGDMLLRDRAALASLAEGDLVPLQLSLGLFIKQKMEGWSLKASFRNDCLRAFKEEGLDASNPAMAMIVKIWKKLRETHRLRIVK